MITIFSATNRPQSNSLKVARNYQYLLEKQGVESNLYSLEDLPSDFVDGNRYGEPPKSFEQTLHSLIVPVEYFVFVVPEYNGSYPGITKLFLDTVHPNFWKGKKAALVGVATGRAGNQRGMDHLASVLNYLRVEVYSQKLPLSSIHMHLNDRGSLVNEEYVNLLNSQIKGLIRLWNLNPGPDPQSSHP